MDPEQGEVVSDRSFSYGEVDDGVRAGATSSSRGRTSSRAGRPARSRRTASSPTGTTADGTLTAWSNFQGPFTLHSVAASALGLPGSRLRLITPPHSGGSFGIKATVYVYVVLIGLASRKLGIPVRWTEDRLEHLTAARRLRLAARSVQAALLSNGELLALRYDALEDVGAYIRAPEPATLYRMHGSLAGAYRVRNIAARNRVVLTNRCPTGLNRGFGGPQLYLALERTMDVAARRLGLDPAELRRRNLVEPDAFPYRTPSGALYDSGDYEACLDDALELVRYDERRAEQRAARAKGGWSASVSRASSSRRSRTWATSPWPKRPTSAREALPKSGNVEGATVVVSPPGGSHGTGCDDAPGAGARDRVCADRRRRARHRARRHRSADRDGHVDERVDGGIGQLLVPFLGRRCRCGVPRRSEARGQRCGDPRAPRRRVALAAAGGRESPTGTPLACRRNGARVARDCVLRHPTSIRRTSRTRVASSAAHGFIADVAVVEVDRAYRRSERARLRDSARRRPNAQPVARRRADPRRLRTWRRRCALRARRLRRRRRPPHGDVHGLPLPDGARPPGPEDRPPGDAVSVHAAGREGARRGGHDERARGDRERGRRRARSRRRRAAAHAGPRVGAPAA